MFWSINGMTIALISNSVTFDELLLQTNKLNLATLTAAVAFARRLGTYHRNIRSDTVLQVPTSLGKCTLLLFAPPGRLNLSTLKRLLLTPMLNSTLNHFRYRTSACCLSYEGRYGPFSADF